MRRLPQQCINVNVRRERDPRVLRRQMRLLAACFVLAVGFVVAVRQHLAAVEYGYKTEALRREREALREEQRRLLVMLEEKSSPENLERAARELGLQPARAAQIETGTRLVESQTETRAALGATTAAGVLRR